MKVAFIVLLGAVAALAAPSDNSSWRIVGGNTASDGQFPYIISLRYYGDHSCGGSILDETTVITAAHCVDGRSASALTVVAGSNKLNEGGDTYKVKRIIRHEDYNANSITNDIALLKLETPIQFNDKVQLHEIRTEYLEKGKDCTLSGWGTMIVGGNIPNNLQYITLTTLSFEDCKEKQNSGIEIVDSEICTLTKAGEGACHGDSGGPLVDYNHRLVGLVSWGTPCAVGKPDVFTRVSAFLDWVEANRK